MQASLFIIALLCLGILVSCSTHTSQETTAEEKLRVQINATEDTITLRFIRPHANADTHAPRLQLEGYLLGYGGSMFSKQYIELPQDGTPYYAEMDAEPKYLISVEPVKPHVEKKKACPNKVDLKKPLHLVIGSITDTKVLLSWGTILNTPYTQQDADCPEDSQYTIRYREKDPNPESTPAPTAAPTTPSPPGRERQWNYQSCPSSTTVVDKLKPDTPYEFEVRTDTDPKGPSGEWSGPVVHNTNASVTETIVTLMENSNKEIEKPFKPPVVPIIPHAKETKPDVAVEGMQGVTLTKPAPKPRNGGYIESTANSSVFSAVPTSEEDAMGNKRFIAPHVVYQTDKGPKEPCSITRTLSHFPDDEVTEVNVTAPPRNAPENVTVVAVEGCPSFVIIDWDKGDNETTEYEVTSSTKGPSGKEVSVLVTNKTHTAVENLNPESSYQFTVTPKNELGTGPSSEPVSFRTESVDPQVAEVTGKRAIWSTFPFKLDIQSECNGPQYIKRTWYRKFVGIQLCNSLRYKIYLSDSLRGPFYHIGDLSGHGEDHCQFVDSLLDGRTGSSIPANHLPETEGFYRAMRQEPVTFGTIGGNSHINYVSWYECGVSIPGKW